MRFLMLALAFALFLLAAVSCSRQPSAPDLVEQGNAWRIVAPAVPDT